MSPAGPLLAAGAALTLSGAVALALLAAREQSVVANLLEGYRRWWNDRARRLRGGRRLHSVPALQAALVPTLLVAAYGAGEWPFLVAALVAALGPPLLLRERARRSRERLAAQLDGTLTALANALGTTPNLGDALQSLIDTVDDPMRQEIATVLGEVRIGRSLDEALTALAERVRIPGFEAAVAAAIMGRRTGGDLPEILRRTAATLREMARLEGVVRTKTAEGRSQSLVMGLVPPILILALHKIDPHWLAPLWHDPLGWIILGLAAVFEVAAIALIRRIMAVDL